MATSNRALDYLASPKNLVGLGLAVVASGVALFTGAAGDLWPLISVASYGIGAVATPGRRRIIGALPADHVYTREELEAALEEDAELAPPELQEQVATVIATLRDVLGRWDQVSTVGQVQLDISATILDYLPTTLRNYAQIPADLRRRAQNGRTPLQATQNQLAMLAEYANQARDAAFADQLRALDAQGAFLESKWKKSSLDL